VLELLTRVLAVCCLVGLSAAHAAEAENAQSAGQISNKRNQACKDLKGAAREQCLNGYVGPDEGQRYGRDTVYTTKQRGSRPSPVKGQSEWTKPGRY
jgi:hypothetical protein